MEGKLERRGGEVLVSCREMRVGEGNAVAPYKVRWYWSGQDEAEALSMQVEARTIPTIDTR